MVTIIFDYSFVQKNYIRHTLTPDPRLGPTVGPRVGDLYELGRVGPLVTTSCGRYDHRPVGLLTARLEKAFGSKGKQHAKHTASEAQTKDQFFQKN